MSGRVPWEVDAATSARLARIPQSHTKPEQIVRAIVTSLGGSYRLNRRSLPGSPDLANVTRRWAIFVHGCYWHHHEGCRRATVPKRNRKLWIDKFQANRERDRRALRRLRLAGFHSLVVWECETEDIGKLTRRLVRFFRAAETAPRKDGQSEEPSANN